MQKIVIAISISLLCCHFNSTESLQLIYNEGRQGLSDVRGKAHEHKKVGVIEKFLVNVVLYYLCISDGYGTWKPCFGLLNYTMENGKFSKWIDFSHFLNASKYLKYWIWVPFLSLLCTTKGCELWQTRQADPPYMSVIKQWLFKNILSTLKEVLEWKVLFNDRALDDTHLMLLKLN